MNQAGDQNQPYSWLSTESNQYGDPEFSKKLAGKLGDLTMNSVGPGAWLHYNNVSVAYTHLYGFDMEGTGANAAVVSRSGDQGSIAELRIPANAGLLRKAWNIVVGPELTWSADANNTDFNSEAEAVLARKALKYYWTSKGVGSKAKGAAFESMAFAECAIHAPWDKAKGKAIGVDPETGALVSSGAARYTKIPTWDILRDPTAASFESLEYIIIREWPNKYDVAAMSPDAEFKQKCMSIQSQLPGQSWMPFRWVYNAASDRIPVYYLYAKRTSSCPGGRQAVFLNDGTVVPGTDQPLDEAYADEAVADLPQVIGAVAFMRVGEYAGTPWPSTKWTGTLGCEQASDSLARDLVTNATAVSGQVIFAQQSALDAALEATVQGGGPKVVPLPDGAKEPTVMKLNAPAPEHFKLRDELRGECVQMMGLDAITAGNADVGKSLSGAAMALMTSTSVQNNSQEQDVWTKFVQAIGNLTLMHWKYHMSEPEKIAIAGSARAALVTATQLKPGDMQNVSRVFATIGNALQQTEAGRYTLLETAMDKGWVKTPEQAQEVMDTGCYDALSEDLSNALLVIRSENEAIARGENPPVMLEDDHMLHIKRHASVMASLSARGTEAVVLALQAHNDAHVRALRETDPVILAATGQQSIAPPPAPGAESGTPPPGGPPSPQMEQKAKAPGMPTNPKTGQTAHQVAGQRPPEAAVKPGIA